MTEKTSKVKTEIVDDDQVEIIQSDDKDLRFECANLAFDYLQDTDNVEAIFLLANRIYEWISKKDDR